MNFLPEIRNTWHYSYSEWSTSNSKLFNNAYCQNKEVGREPLKLLNLSYICISLIWRKINYGATWKATAQRFHIVRHRIIINPLMPQGHLFLLQPKLWIIGNIRRHLWTGYEWPHLGLTTTRGTQEDADAQTGLLTQHYMHRWVAEWESEPALWL